ncbi:MAG: response regulator [Candidatus Omnitrophota bacterium]
MAAKGKKIVIADDNRELCDLVNDVMRRQGHEVSSVYNGYELIAYIEKNTPAVIILDLMMPGKDGLSIIDTIKQLSPYSRIIIYTGYHEYKRSVYGRSVDDFVVKGGSIKDLVTAVEKYL